MAARQALRDHQAEAAAAEQTRRLGARLDEGGEQPAQCRGRDARTAVLDLEHQPDPARRRRAGSRAHGDVAGRGELDRVADQVDQDLAQPARIQADSGRRAGQKLAAEGEPALARPRLELQAQPVEEGGEIDIDRGELEPAGVDPAEIENVVDQGEQGLGGFQGAVEIAPLLGVQGRVAQQARHADHTVHRLADLVAHHRQEAGPGEARLLGAPAAAPEPLDLGRVRRCRIGGRCRRGCGARGGLARRRHGDHPASDRREGGAEGQI